MPNNQSQQNQPVPGLIKYTFDYPFEIVVPPSDYPVALATGEMGVVRISHEKGLLTIDRGRFTSEGKKQVLIKRKRNKGEIKAILDDGAAIYSEFDEYGKMIFPKYYTKIQIIFRVSDVSAIPIIKGNFEHIQDITFRIFDKFIISYIYGIKDFTIRLPKKEQSEWPTNIHLYSHDFSKKEMKLLSSSDDPLSIIGIIHGIKKFKVYRGYEHTKGYVSSELKIPEYTHSSKKHSTREDLKKALGAMMNPRNIEPYYRFLFSSIVRSHMDKEHTMALVDLATTFEIALSYYYDITRLCLEGFNFSKPDEEISRKLEKEYKEYDDLKLVLFDYPERESRIKLFDDLKTEFNSLLNKPYSRIQNNPTFKDWHNKVWKVRHKIVHTGKNDTTEEDIKEALKLTQDVIHLMESTRDELQIIWKLKKVRNSYETS